jgi:hypothetical protein
MQHSHDPCWTVYNNTSGITNAPPNVHMDIEIIVPTGATITDIYDRLDAEHIGRIAGHYIPCAQLPDDTKKVVCIVFEFWYRTKPAIAMQQALLTTEFVYMDPHAHVDGNTHAEINEGIGDYADADKHWRIHQSIRNPILKGRPQYTWYNHV